jgi:hypothetical protein
MKTEIRKFQYGTLSLYSWVETCDRCGHLISTSSVLRNYAPDIEQEDLCSECLKHQLETVTNMTNKLEVK